MCIRDRIDEGRIAAEVVIFSDKICTDEEVVRLKSHIKHLSLIHIFGVVTGKTNYADLEKCYSIWICLEDVPVRLRNTMTEYRIRKEDVLGETDEPEEDYDLMSVIVIRMGEKSEERGIFDYLNQVFVGNIEEIEDRKSTRLNSSHRL